MTLEFGDYPVLLAGTQTKALALATEVARGLYEFHELRKPDEDHRPVPWETLLQVAVLRRKNLIAEEIVGGSFGITYDEFLKNGKQSFPEDIHRETMAEIARTTLDCWLLVLGFAQSQARIYRIGPTGSVETCENFAAIGSGAYVAEAALFQRNQSVETDLGTTIYNVYEAMKLGSIAPGVGEKFQIGVAEWDWYEQPNPHNDGEVKISFLEPAYYQHLAKHFERFGPRQYKRIQLWPRLIKEPQKAVVTTPKGEMNPEHIKAVKRTKAAREREAKKKAAREAANAKATASAAD